MLPRHIYKVTAELGVLAPGFPIEYGGLGNYHNDLSALMVVCEELCRSGSGGFIASLLTHNISLNPIIHHGVDRDLADRVAREVLSGISVCFLCITEPSGGSDVANITTATREGDSYILNGEKCFITSGMQADTIR